MNSFASMNIGLKPICLICIKEFLGTFSKLKAPLASVIPDKLDSYISIVAPGMVFSSKLSKTKPHIVIVDALVSV